MYLEELIKKHAPEIADQIIASAKWAKSETDLQIEVEKLLEPFKKQAKIDLKGHHNVTIGTGRPDSVYSSVVIEYKKPKRLGTSNSDQVNKEVIEQLKQRFIDLEKEEKRPKNKTFGVGTDGFRFIFVRYRANDWEISDTVDVSTKTVEIFLRRLSSLGMTGKALLPSYLQGDFGEGSDMAKMAIQTFYRKIGSLKTARASKLFEQWEVMFREVCGYDLQSPKKHIVNLGRKYGISEQVIPSNLLFAIHSYYAMFMKLLATEIVHFFYGMPTYLGKIGALTGPGLRDEIVTLEKKGGIFKQMGITNFLEGDLFSWYLDEWGGNIEKVMHAIIQKLQEYDPGTLTVEPQESRDLLKQLYQYLIDKPVRHDLGEYYTPDWLAELVLERVGYIGNPDKRVLDPACGSGTFLIMAINKIREYAEEKMIPPRELLEKILKNVVGFDLNPLAVMAARTNYLIALGDLLKYATGEIEIPIYLCDSVLIPKAFTTLYVQAREVRTSVGKFQVPICVVDEGEVGTLADAIEHSVDHNYSQAEFLKLSKTKLNLKDEDYERSEELLRDMFRKIVNLKKNGINSIWSRFIKNAFAPVFKGKFDYVVGNPPWINWQNLSNGYRKDTKSLWKKYFLVAKASGDQFELGKKRRDFSMLFLVASVDSYLEKGGKLGFVITQSLFKSPSAEVFRQFRLSQKESYRVLEVIDLTELQPFEDATNRTSVVIVERGKTIKYPVSYAKWTKKRSGRIDAKISLKEAKAQTEHLSLVAVPIDDGNQTSPWLTVEPSLLDVARKMIGDSHYSASAGVCTWLNGAYWVSIDRRVGEELILVRNLATIGKKEVPQIEMSLERDFVYPLLRGRDVSRWKGNPSAHIVLPHTRDTGWRAISKSRLRTRFPRTYAYFSKLEKHLLGRSGYRLMRKGHPFYICVNVNEDTFAPFKVVWRYVATDMISCVVGSHHSDLLGRKRIVPDCKLMAVPLKNGQEAYFLSGVLNSSLLRFVATRYFIGTQISTHILKNIKVPRFEKSNSTHKRISSLSKEAHKLARKDDTIALLRVEKELDKEVRKLWDISAKHLSKIREMS